jgi:hypothetical protein
MQFILLHRTADADVLRAKNSSGESLEYFAVAEQATVGKDVVYRRDYPTNACATCGDDIRKACSFYVNVYGIELLCFEKRDEVGGGAKRSFSGVVMSDISSVLKNLGVRTNGRCGGKDMGLDSGLLEMGTCHTKHDLSPGWSQFVQNVEDLGGF